MFHSDFTKSLSRGAKRFPSSSHSSSPRYTGIRGPGGAESRRCGGRGFGVRTSMIPGSRECEGCGWRVPGLQDPGVSGGSAAPSAERPAAPAEPGCAVPAERRRCAPCRSRRGRCGRGAAVPRRRWRSPRLALPLCPGSDSGRKGGTFLSETFLLPACKTGRSGEASIRPSVQPRLQRFFPPRVTRMR